VQPRPHDFAVAGVVDVFEESGGEVFEAVDAAVLGGQRFDGDE
jgi:hypothetical protein